LAAHCRASPAAKSRFAKSRRRTHHPIGLLPIGVEPGRLAAGRRGILGQSRVGQPEILARFFVLHWPRGRIGA